MPAPKFRPVLQSAVAAAAVVFALGCGTSDEATSSSADSTSASQAPFESTTAATTTAVPAAPTATDAPTTETPATATPATTAPTTNAVTTTTTTSELTGTLAVPIRSGTFGAGPDDLFILTDDGDLELWSGALSKSLGPRTLVADYVDPFGPVNEGSGPNVIDHVAGQVGGSVVFGDCCEPISGNVLAATASAEASPVAGGFSPTLSPTGELLGIANDFLITQTAADPGGAGVFRQLNQQTQPYLNVADLAWSSNATATADDDHLVLLGWSDDGWWLHDVDRSTLEPTPAFDLGVPPVPEAPDTNVRFAGYGPDAEIVVAVTTASTTRLRYFEPSTLAERPLLERSLPNSATSIRLASGGMGLLWIDDSVLYHLPDGEFEADPLGTGYLAAWFAVVAPG